MYTGAAFSIFPHSSTSLPCGPALAGAAGQPILCWGEKQFQLSFNGKGFSWPFLLAAVQFPIIGVDFLHHYGLLVDPAGNQPVDRLTLQPFHSSPLGPGASVIWPGVFNRHQLLLEFTGLYSPGSLGTSLYFSHQPLRGLTGLYSFHQPLLISPASPQAHRPLQLLAASLRGPTC